MPGHGGATDGAHDLGLGVDAVPLGVSRRAGSCALVIAEPLLLSWIEGT